MNGVYFDNLHSFRDLNLILNEKTIGSAAIKTAKIDIPGADGELDYTDYFGDIKYYNRPLEFNFSTIINLKNFLALYTRLQGLFHGQKMKITLDEDSDFYYIGRVTVNEWKSNKRIGKIVISVDAEPYKFKKATTIVSRTISGKTIINCVNSRKWVIPNIRATGSISLGFGDYTSAVFSGDIPQHIQEQIIFKQGQNPLTVTPQNGSVTVTIEYQEGEL